MSEYESGYPYMNFAKKCNYSYADVLLLSDLCGNPKDDVDENHAVAFRRCPISMWVAIIGIHQIEMRRRARVEKEHAEEKDRRLSAASKGPSGWGKETIL